MGRTEGAAGLDRDERSSDGGSNSDAKGLLFPQGTKRGGIELGSCELDTEERSAGAATGRESEPALAWERYDSATIRARAFRLSLASESSRSTSSMNLRRE